jgi:hypothetical protein
MLTSDSVFEECHKLFELLEEARLQRCRIMLEPDFKRHFSQLPDICHSSRSGCIVCTLLLEAYESRDLLSNATKTAGSEATKTDADVPSLYVDNHQYDTWTIGLRLVDRVQHWQKLTIILYKKIGQPKSEVA